jgi:heat shock protein HslJ
MRKYIAVGALALGLLAACGDDDTEQTQPPASEPAAAPSTAAGAAADLNGMSFTAAELVVDGQARPAAAGTQLTLSFADGNVSADFGCNTGSGPYRVEDGALVVERLSTTRKACAGELGDQDGFMNELLASSPAVQLDGDQLTLTGPRIVFTGTTA